VRRAFDWLQERTGFRGARHALLDEPIPPGTGWFFTLGSVLLALIGIQILTGAFLTLYYAATPDHAYDSIRFIISTGPGRIVRGLHHYGASFIVVAVVLHMVRVVVFGSYKPPREATWLSGLLLLGLILAFSLTGYLLPWDQRAYWATVVTINIARLTPFAGELVGGLLRGGASVGALTLTRWYALHVIFLPLGLLSFVALHLFLMRRQGISGPIRPRPGEAVPFYPWQAARDTAVVTIVLLVLAALAWKGAPPLEAPADPSDSSFIPRPEWYFLGLFQLLKYFPGKWEVVGAMILPGLVALLLVLLPWLDRGPTRDPRRRPLVMMFFAAGLFGVALLTSLGWRDRPVNQASATTWTLREIGGRQFAQSAGCARCHATEGLGDPLESIAVSRGPEWLGGHVTDPEMIAPGLREPPRPMSEREVTAIVAYVRKLSRQGYPGFDARTETVGRIFARYCVGCHTIDGEGGTDGPNLSHVGSEHDVDHLRRLIDDPESVNPKAEMPSFGTRLSEEELNAMAAYLAGRK
jgi:ubiquinol-cytochrome c reductase cytochrome b subunit